MPSKRIVFLLVSGVCMSLLLTPLPVLSEVGGVAFIIRTVHASEPYMKDSPISQRAPLHVDARLNDLRSKLEKLNYRSFIMQGEKRDVVPLRKRRSYRLSCGHTLTVRPLYMEEERIGLWMQWLDETGMKMLDTRMHLTPGETMLTGTETQDDNGTILAINVKPSN